MKQEASFHKGEEERQKERQRLLQKLPSFLP
jgi:hypothetical protein